MKCTTCRALVTCMIAGAIAGLVVTAVLGFVYHNVEKTENLEAALLLENPDFGAKVLALYRTADYGFLNLNSLAKEYLGEDYQYGRPLENVNLMVKILTREQYFVSRQGRIKKIK